MFHLSENMVETLPLKNPKDLKQMTATLCSQLTESLNLNDGYEDSVSNEESSQSDISTYDTSHHQAMIKSLNSAI